MKTETRYISFDGKEFKTEAECAAYETKHWDGLLIGMTKDQLDAAKTRTDIARANALERIGVGIAKVRLANGDRRRKPKASKDGEAAKAPAGSS
jgi:hypothetical protein